MVGAAIAMRYCHRDHEARRAKATLRSMMVDHRLLYRVKRAIGACDPLDGSDRAPGQLRQKQDAGIQRPRAAIRVGHHHGAGTAITLVATFLGAGEPPFLAEPIQERRSGGRIDLHRFPVEKKPDCHDFSLPRYPIPGRSSGARCGVERGPVLFDRHPQKRG